MDDVWKERFLSKVMPDPESDCLLWMGSKIRQGYGHVNFKIQGKWKKALAHRFMWELTNGPIPEGAVVRHLVCDNPPCVNPDHLALGTVADNNHDRDRIGHHWRITATHCINGHELTEGNTYSNPKVKRGCVACRTAAQQRSNIKRRAKYAREKAMQ